MVEQDERKKGGAGGIIIIIVVMLLIGAGAWFMMKKPGGKPKEKMPAAVEVLPENSVVFVQTDLSKLEDPSLKEKMIEGFKTSPGAVELTKNLKETDVDFEEDVMSWIGDQAVFSLMTVPSTEEKPEPEDMNGAMVFTVKDKEKAKTKLPEVLGKIKKLKFVEEKYGEHAYWTPEGKISPAIGFLKGFLVMASNKESFMKCADVADKKAKSIKENAEINNAIKKIDGPSIALVFFNTGEFSKIAAESGNAPPQAKMMSKGFKSVIYSVRQENGNFIATGFMSLDKNTDNPVVKSIMEAKPQMEVPASLKLFPKDTSFYVAVDSGFINNLLTQVAAANPNGADDFEKNKAMVKKQFGIDVDNDIIANLSGELAVSFSFTEVIAQAMGGGQAPTANPAETNLKKLSNALEMYATDNNGKYPAALEKLTPDYIPSVPALPGRMKYYYKADNGQSHFTLGYTRNGRRLAPRQPWYDSDTGMQGTSSARSRRGRNAPPPILFALKFKDNEAIKSVVGKLTANPQFGQMLKKSTVGDADVYAMPEGVGKAAVYDQFLVFGLGGAGQKIDGIIENKMDESKSLMASDGFKLIKDKLGKNTLSVYMVQFKEVLPMIESLINMQAAQNPEETKPVKDMVEILKKYNEVWAYSEIAEDGIKVNVVVLKSKE